MNIKSIARRSVVGSVLALGAPIGSVMLSGKDNQESTASRLQKIEDRQANRADWSWGVSASAGFAKLEGVCVVVCSGWRADRRQRLSEGWPRQY